LSTTGDARSPRRVVVAIGAVALLAIAAGLAAWRWAPLPGEDHRAAVPSDRASILPKGAASRFLQPRPVGLPFDPKTRPLVAHVAIVDLDKDGLADIVACDVLANRVVWLRQQPRGTFTETPVGTEVRAPAHAEAVDIDGDGDLDLLVASLGVMFPSNARIGSIVVLENDGRGRFTNRVIARDIARVADVRAGDLDGDGDLDLAVAGFGYDDGETHWMENLGSWRFRSTRLLNLSGAINVEIVDLDRDSDLDIASLVSQEWEEIYAFVNDGRGRFETKLLWGSTNDDFGSSWLTAVDLDKDGDVDFLYSNGDAFDYAPPSGRPWHGVQWLENTGAVNFAMHRLADFSGASSPQPVDLDGDGDLDVVVVSAYNAWDDPSAQSLIWLENDGRMRFAMHDIASSPTHLVTVGAGDLTGDGLADLVTGGMHISRPYDRMSRITMWTNGAVRAR
jgi:FG-GAP-like repeat